ncbi:Urb2/Npa2 family-domain-containing protein [Cytidiella melzeri]|nr:Urb2/Npa2 family-domain-containing protein [Cytidiella melzeri]
MPPLSAQDFVRALRAPSDPPQPGGPTKLELARATWDDESRLVPNKEENIVEWILTRLLKEKDTSRRVKRICFGKFVLLTTLHFSSSNHLLDLQIWQLLSDILHVSAKSTTGSRTSRTLRTWLLPLLNRIPTAPILVAFLGLADHDFPTALLYVGCRTLSLLWPIAVPKINIDTLLDCYSAVVRCLARREWQQPEGNTREAVTRLVDLVVASYRSSLSNSVAKRKLYAKFIQTTFHDWIECTSSDDLAQSFPQSHAELYQAGIDTLFSLDVLRQAQGQADDTIENTLKDAISSSPSAILSCVPRIFQSYVHVTQKHRNTLFSQGSSRGSVTSAEQARKAGMKFFASCIAVINSIPANDSTWRTTAALLEFVDLQRLLGLNDEAATHTLRGVVELACDLLASHITDTQCPQVASALVAFATVIHIDYDIAAPILPRVMRIIATRPLPIDLSSVLLKHILEYNAQTRSADAVVDLLLTAFGSHTFTSLSSSYGSLYITAATTALLHHAFLDDLSKFVYAFTTPGQISTIIQNTLEHLRVASFEFEQRSKLGSTEDDSVPRKKRKTEKGSLSASDGIESFAISFATLAGIASVALTSLPLHLLQDNDRRVVVGTIQEYYGSFKATLKNASKRICSGDSSSTWSWQIVASAMIRLRYALGSDRTLQLDTEGNAKVIVKFSPLLKVEGLLPQLRIEILRTWFMDVEKGRSEPTPAFDEALSYLEKWLPRCDHSWNGDLCHLAITDEGQAEAAVVILHMLLDRWLSLCDSDDNATQEQCRRLVALISSIQARQTSCASASYSGITLEDVLHRALHNALFWESHTLRDALLSLISTETTLIDEVDIKQLLSEFHSRTPSTALPPDGLSSVVANTFGLLLSTPVEYLTRKARSDLMRRAQAADIALSSASIQSDVVCVTMLREFLRRMHEFLGSVDHTIISDYLSVLMDSFERLEPPPDSFVSTTLELINMYLRASVKLAVNSEGILLQILDSFIQSPALNAHVGQYSGAQLRVRALVHLVDILTTECKPKEITEGLQSKLLALKGHLSGWLLPQMHAIGSAEHGADAALHLPILQLWHRLLALSSWLSCNDRYPEFGRTLTRRQLTCANSLRRQSTEVYVVILSIVHAELLAQSHETGGIDLSAAVATYLAFCDLCSASVDINDLDECMAKFCRLSPPSDFSSMMDLLYDGLSTKGLCESSIGSLIQVTNVMMRNSPEGSLKLLQTHLSRCLNLFANLVAGKEGSYLRSNILAFMGYQFNDRPAMIRQQDLSSVWSILGSCFKGSTLHDSFTCKNTFSDIVAIISALLRLRRDLIATTLPQLTCILRRLIMSLRRLRPHLGGKQTRIVSDTLPNWINPHETARAEDGKAVARLLTTLTTKTIVRTYGSNSHSATEGQKAESLARPFSKHAAYVLCAYIVALNDPLCVLQADVRKELEPGLFALCDMMGEHNRDAMMVASLDLGGKSVMKGIWREYEKQKYVGKG